MDDWAEEDGADQEPDLAGILAESLLPRYDRATFQVLEPISGDVMGRIKPMHPGKSNEAITVYCRRHGCAPGPKRIKEAHSLGVTLEWFRCGMEMTSREDHMRAWQSLGRGGPKWP